MTADDVDVQRRKWLVGEQASEGGAGIWIRVPITINDFTIAYVCGDVATYARPPEPLGNAAQSALEAMMVLKVQSTDDAFAHVRGHSNARRVTIAIHMSEKSIHDNK